MDVLDEPRVLGRPPFRALIVEDDQRFAELLGVLLQGSEASACFASRIDEAHAVVEEEVVDVIVLDLGLPDAWGLDGLSRLRETFPQVPVIVLTGNAETDLALAALRSGAQDYLRKQEIDAAMLIRACRYAIERSQLLDRVRIREQHYRLLIETAEDAFVSIDAAGEISDWNDRAERLFGWSRSEAVGQRPDETFLSGSSEQRERLREGLQAVEVEATHRAGYTIPVEVTTWQADSTLNAFVRDVRVRRGLEEQLLQSQRLEAVGQLAGGVAHDFNNLLTAIRGFVDLGLAQEPTPEKLRPRLEQIGSAADHATTLVAQLLAFSRKQPLQRKVVDLRTVVLDAKPLIERVAGDGVDVTVETGPEHCTVAVDPDQLVRVVLNLVANARDAAPRGSIRIRTALETHSLDNGSPGMPAGVYAVMRIRDNGPGMDKETLRHAFEPFYTTKERSRGTGLGLASVYGIVKQSGGYIWLQSEVGFGTEATIYLPVTTEKISAPAAAPEPLRQAEGRARRRVLLVEDDAIVRDVVREILEESEFGVTVATSAAAALEVIQSDEPIDTIISDISMPGMTGIELVEATHKLRPGLDMLLISGYSPDEIRLDIRLPTAFLQKPFTSSQLLEALESQQNG
jgi:two-component system cell cycle sensor histidine kinase/response regulator CckA